MSRKVIAHQGDTVELLCWRHLGRTAGVVEQTLELNPGLAGRGAALPEGAPVTLPDMPKAAPSAPLIQLWS